MPNNLLVMQASRHIKYTTCCARHNEASSQQCNKKLAIFLTFLFAGVYLPSLRPTNTLCTLFFCGFVCCATEAAKILIGFPLFLYASVMKNVVSHYELRVALHVFCVFFFLFF